MTNSTSTQGRKIFVAGQKGNFSPIPVAFYQITHDRRPQMRKMIPAQEIGVFFDTGLVPFPQTIQSDIERVSYVQSCGSNY